MKLIILSAGQGNRLKPLTDNKPKCMVEYKGRPLIDHIISANRACEINDIVLINGFKGEILESYLSGSNIRFYTNDRFDKTNMVYTLFCAEKEMDDDIIISYGDIYYGPKIIEKLINSDADIGIAVDSNWRSLWELRMDDPLKDAETLKYDKNENIIELGKKPVSYDEIQGQYMGLIKISKNIINKIKEIYTGLDKNRLYDGKDFENMYMTSFLQYLIDTGIPCKAVLITEPWMEIDNVSDLSVDVG